MRGASFSGKRDLVRIAARVVMAGLVPAISVRRAAAFLVEMAGKCSLHAASVLAKDRRALRALCPAMT